MRDALEGIVKMRGSAKPAKHTRSRAMKSERGLVDGTRNILPHGERTQHLADGPWKIGKGVKAFCGKFVGKFYVVTGGGKVCEACSAESGKRNRP
mgnify:CR=1 FL=1